jgi:hypothetical protein
MRSLNTGALLRAVGVSAVILLLMVGCGWGVNFAVGIRPGEIPDPNSLPSGYQIYSSCLSCFALLLYLGYGALYGWFAQRGGSDIETGPMALGGAITGLIVAVISAVMSGVTLAFTGPAMVEQFQQQFAVAGVPISSVAPFMLVGVAIGLCVVLALGGGIGAGGGVLYALIARGKQKKDQPAV